MSKKPPMAPDNRSHNSRPIPVPQPGTAPPPRGVPADAPRWKPDYSKHGSKK
jgi:hypothetical protein